MLRAPVRSTLNTRMLSRTTAMACCWLLMALGEFDLVGMVVAVRMAAEAIQRTLGGLCTCTRRQNGLRRDGEYVRVVQLDARATAPCLEESVMPARGIHLNAVNMVFRAAAGNG